MRFSSTPPCNSKANCKPAPRKRDSLLPRHQLDRTRLWVLSKDRKFHSTSQRQKWISPFLPSSPANLCWDPQPFQIDLRAHQGQERAWPKYQIPDYQAPFTHKAAPGTQVPCDSQFRVPTEARLLISNPASRQYRCNSTLLKRGRIRIPGLARPRKQLRSMKPKSTHSRFKKNP